MTTVKKQRPEALATFAEAARSGGQKPKDIGLIATPNTAPIPTDPAAKDEAATRVLLEGATGEDQGADEAVDSLPDRVLESRASHRTTDDISDLEDREGSESLRHSQDPVQFDASKDPRTGRPMQPLAAEALRKERLADQAIGAGESNDRVSEDDEARDELESEDDDLELEPGQIAQPAGAMRAPEDTEDLNGAEEDDVLAEEERERATNI